MRSVWARMTVTVVAVAIAPRTSSAIATVKVECPERACSRLLAADAERQRQAMIARATPTRIRISSDLATHDHFHSACAPASANNAARTAAMAIADSINRRIRRELFMTVASSEGAISRRVIGGWAVDLNADRESGEQLCGMREHPDSRCEITLAYP